MAFDGRNEVLRVTRHVQINGPGKIEVTVPKCYLVVVLLNVVDVRLPRPVSNDVAAFATDYRVVVSEVELFRRHSTRSGRYGWAVVRIAGATT